MIIEKINLFDFDCKGLCMFFVEELGEKVFCVE